MLGGNATTLSPCSCSVGTSSPQSQVLGRALGPSLQLEGRTPSRKCPCRGRGLRGRGVRSEEGNCEPSSWAVIKEIPTRTQSWKAGEKLWLPLPENTWKINQRMIQFLGGLIWFRWLLQLLQSMRNRKAPPTVMSFSHTIVQMVLDFYYLIRRSGVPPCVLGYCKFQLGLHFTHRICTLFISSTCWSQWSQLG